jgi:hypothetical protein
MENSCDSSSLQRTSLSDIFLNYNLDKNVRIIDVACGVGIVAEEIGKFGYKNIDGLDPANGYIKVVKARGIYKVIHMLRICSVLFITFLMTRFTRSCYRWDTQIQYFWFERTY